MSQYHSNTSSKHDQQQDSNALKVPGLSEGYVGSADIPSDRPGYFSEHNRNFHPVLPGMEECCRQAAPYEFNIRPISLTDEAKAILDKAELARTVQVGACLNIYPSGEVTGGYYKTGSKAPPRREGKTISQEFTSNARKTIRRAAESGLVTFKNFVTFTFDPKLSELDDSGSVIQSWGKQQFKRLLNSFKKVLDRRAEIKGEQPLSYIWVAEVQQNGNIHFHMLVDRFIPIKWLVKIWNQAPNSVNLKKLSNQSHAVNYMLKYMKKGHCPIEGKRYGMTKDLLDAIKPIKIRYEGEDKREAFKKVKRESYWEINNNGGMVSDFGLSIPSPKRPRFWRDKQGQIHKAKGVSPELSAKFLSSLNKHMKRIDFEHEIDEVLASKKPVDLPF